MPVAPTSTDVLATAPRSRAPLQCAPSIHTSMRLPHWRSKTRPVVIFNTSLTISSCLYLLITAGLNLATIIYPEVHRPHPFNTTTGCNGRTEYCTRPYSNISQIGTHGSAFWGILPSHNQNMGIRKQMDAGVRFLQVQTHQSAIFKQMKACHTSCFVEDAGTLEDYLLRLKEWINEPGHEREVVSVLITNGDFVGVGAYEAVFRRVGITDMIFRFDSDGSGRKTKRERGPPPPLTSNPARPASFSPPPSPQQQQSSQANVQWPTLNEMIKLNQRIVIFLDYGARPAQVPYILDEFAHFWETPFDTTDPSFNQCTIDRPLPTKHTRAAIESRMYLVNHYLDTKVMGAEVPDRKDASRTNDLENESGIRRQVELCKREHEGRVPRVVLVDYFDVGQVRKAEAYLNGFDTEAGV